MTEAEKERAEIVAFIREQQGNANDHLLQCTDSMRSQRFAAAFVTCKRIADAIEALAHKDAGNANTA